MEHSRVDAVLSVSREKIQQLKDNAFLPLADRQEFLANLREGMFVRRENGEAFHPLSNFELGVVHSQMAVYRLIQRLFIAEGSRKYGFDVLTPILRHNYLSGSFDVTPEFFRKVAKAMFVNLFHYLGAERGIEPEEARIVMPWRAGLAFGVPGHEWGCRSFHHLGAKRDERTLETEIYYERELVADGGAWIIADPMLATGKTQRSAIDRLLSAGVDESAILVLAAFAAPEGIDNVLHAYPGIRIVTVALDECLDRNGYIVPGLGDFGDLFFSHIEEAEVMRWAKLGILDDEAFAALQARMRECA